MKTSISLLYRGKYFIGPVKRSLCLTTLLPVVLIGPLIAQTAKTPVTEKDYHLWGNLYPDKISQNGNWVSYRMDYEEHPDTLFVRNSASTITYKFPLGSSGNFNTETDFAALIPGKGLELVTLKTGARKLIADVGAYVFSANGRFLLTQRKSGKGKCLDIRNRDGATIDSIPGSNRYVIDPTGNMVLCSVTQGGNNQLVLITLGTTVAKKIIFESPNGSFTHMVWQANSQSFAFLQNTPSEQKNSSVNRIYYYKIKTSKMYHLAPEAIQGLFKENRIADTYRSKLTISDDGERLFFGIEKKIASAQYDSDQIQIWNGNDKLLYPYRKEYRNWEILPKLTLWEPEKNRVLQIANEQRPYVILNGNQQHAITFDPSETGLQFKENPVTNFYLTDLSSGVSRLWLAEQNTNPKYLSISPTGKYAAYFKDGNWLIYDFVSQTHLNVTQNSIKDLDYHESIQQFPRGLEGWTVHDREILIRDKYDIWIARTDGKNLKRLTAGREQNIIYSIKRPGSEVNFKPNFDGQTGLLSDPYKLLLEGVTNGTENGYFLLDKKQQAVPIAYGTGLVSFLLKAQNSDVYLYRHEAFDRPPSLTLTAIQKGIEKIVFGSNPQHYRYLWGRSEAMPYTNTKKQTLNSVLYYPADYDPLKKYPMIVYIYENWPKQLHHYYNPSLLLENGINPANLTSKGYFVLIPDIEYEIGNPGLSATDCTVSATKEIIRKGLVAPDKIGLIGHSFGGYETNFIITQTNLFAAAVSGAGFADFTGHYFSVGWNWGKAEMWRYEDQQLRMQKSFFEDKAGYDRNSPVQYADKVQTPVLLWTGEEDKQVHYTQCIAFYLALKRNHKKQIMLIYPGAAHVVSEKSHQIDLTHRVEDWFDYYLKGKTPPSWISEGVQ